MRDARRGFRRDRALVPTPAPESGEPRVGGGFRFLGGKENGGGVVGGEAIGEEVTEDLAAA